MTGDSKDYIFEKGLKVIQRLKDDKMATTKSSGQDSNALRNGKQDSNVRVIAGDLALRENTIYPAGIKLLVQGSVLGSKYSLSAGDILVKGDLRIRSFEGCEVEVLGHTEAKTMKVHTLESRTAKVKRMFAWMIRVHEGDFRSGDVGFVDVATEQITHGRGFKCYKITKNVDPLVWNAGAVDSKA